MSSHPKNYFETSDRGHTHDKMAKWTKCPAVKLDNYKFVELM